MKPIVILLLLSLLLSPCPAHAAQITDMRGRRVTVPGHISRVLGASPPVTYMVYSLDPSLLAALNSEPDDDLRRYFRPETLSLPAVGGFAGQAKKFNPEVILGIKPDLVLAWAPRAAALPPRVEQFLTTSNIPFIYLKLDRLDDYPAALRISGRSAGPRRTG